MTATIRVRRIYEPAADDDGTRVLVDRVWPRGLRKQDAHYDEWLKDVAPSAQLRTWFGHDPDKFAEFRRRYREEIEDSPALARLRRLADEGTLTLLTATKKVDLSQAQVLCDLLSG